MALSKSETAASLFENMKLVKKEEKEEKSISVKEPDIVSPILDSNKEKTLIEPISEPVPTVKRGQGRPKKKIGNYVRVSFEVPSSLRDAMDIALKGHDNNLTTYMTDLIRADLNQNLDYYKSLIKPEMKDFW